MHSFSPNRPSRSPGRCALTRRAMLLACTAGILTACSPSPTINQQGSSDDLDATDIPQWRAQIAELCAQIDQQITDGCQELDLDDDVAQWWNQLATNHRMHARTLQRSDPLSGYRSDAASADPGSGLAGVSIATASLEELTATVADLEQRLLIRSVEALDEIGDDTATSMMVASLMVCAHCYSQALQTPPNYGPAPTMGTAVPTRLDSIDAHSRWQALISQIHASIFALETMIGKTDDDQAAAQIRERYDALVHMRERIVALMTARQITPDASEPAYEYSADLDDWAQWAQIRSHCEQSLLACAIACFAADQSARTDLQALVFDQADLVRASGISLSFWPGWV